MNKKLKITIVIFLVLLCVLFAKNILPRVEIFGECSKEGEMIYSKDRPNVCCFGLTPVAGYPDGYKNDCSLLQPPGGIIMCANTNDGVCNVKNLEGKCTSPKDCDTK